jgi:hypothetical protein
MPFLTPLIRVCIHQGHLTSTFFFFQSYPELSKAEPILTPQISFQTMDVIKPLLQ